MESGEPYLNNYMFYKNKEKLQTGKTPTRISTLGAGKCITMDEERSDEIPVIILSVSSVSMFFS